MPEGDGVGEERKREVEEEYKRQEEQDEGDSSDNGFVLTDGVEFWVPGVENLRDYGFNSPEEDAFLEQVLEEVYWTKVWENRNSSLGL